MMKKRIELKSIKKDIIEQLQAGVETQNLYIKDWISDGDGLYCGNRQIMELDGKITRKESLGDRVISMGQMILVVCDDCIDEQELAIEFAIDCKVEDEENNIYKKWITLSI